MIFVTVGTQLPFERLIQAVDRWAEQHPDVEIVMQSGETRYQPRHCRCVAYTKPDEWTDLFNRAELVVSHAGMGTILKAVDTGKPMIIMPRRGDLEEHRNDHQLATAAKFNYFTNIKVVYSPDELLQSMSEPPVVAGPADRLDVPNLRVLIGELRQFVMSLP